MNIRSFTIKLVGIVFAFGLLAQTGFAFDEIALRDFKFYGRLCGKSAKERDLSAADLCYLKMPKGNLSDANLAGAKLNRSEFYNALLFNTNFSNTDLSFVKFNGANLSGANLSGAKLINTDYYDAILKGANFSGADLSGASLKHADLTNANFSNADLSGATLAESFNIESANFSGADLTGVDAWECTYVIDHKPIVGHDGHKRFFVTKKWLRSKGALNVDRVRCRE